MNIHKKCPIFLLFIASYILTFFIAVKFTLYVHWTSISRNFDLHPVFRSSWISLLLCSLRSFKRMSTDTISTFTIKKGNKLNTWNLMFWCINLLSNIISLIFFILVIFLKFGMICYKLSVMYHNLLIFYWIFHIKYDTSE